MDIGGGRVFIQTNSTKNYNVYIRLYFFLLQCIYKIFAGNKITEAVTQYRLILFLIFLCTYIDFESHEHETKGWLNCLGVKHSP